MATASAIFGHTRKKRSASDRTTAQWRAGMASLFTTRLLACDGLSRKVRRQLEHLQPAMIFWPRIANRGDVQGIDRRVREWHQLVNDEARRLLSASELGIFDQVLSGAVSIDTGANNTDGTRQ